MINNEEIRLPTRMSSGSNPELGILSLAIANTDDLVRKVQSLAMENRKLKHKYRSLSQSAVQVKLLYEQERDVCQKIRSQNNELKNKVAGLVGRNSELEHSRINMQLSHSQAIAELEMKNNQEMEKSNNALKELVWHCKYWTENDLKLKAVVRQTIDLLVKRGMDVEKLSPTIKTRSKRKGKQKKEDDSISVASETCSTIFEDIETVQFPDTTDPTQLEATVEKIFVTTETNTETKTFCDKSTTYITSTTTRGVSTECFIKKCDVSTIFPEPTTVSIHDIFKEMIVEIPVLLSPLPEVAPLVSKATQTMRETKDVSCEIANSASVETRSVSTLTQLKNIRKPIEYRLNSKNFTCNIKKEEFFNQFDSTEQEINPQLTQLWIILGKLLFGLIGNGQIFNNFASNSSMGPTWQQIQEISELIEARTVEQGRLRQEYLRQHVAEGINRIEKDCFESDIDDEDDADDGLNACDAAVSTGIETVESEVDLGRARDKQIESETNKGKEVSSETDCFTDSPIRPAPIEKLMTQITSPVASTSRCVSPEITTPPISVPNLETTPLRIKRKLPIDIASPSTDISACCSDILSGAKRKREMFELLSPIKESPVPKTKQLITLSDLFGESDDDEETTKDTVESEALIRSILDDESPVSPPDWCKNPSNIESHVIPLEPIVEEEVDCDYFDTPQSPTMQTEEEDDPVIIPLDRIGAKKETVTRNIKTKVPATSALHAIINQYDRATRAEVIKKTLMKKHETPKMSHDIEVLRKSIDQYLQGEWNREATQLMCQKCMKYINDVDIVIVAILETIEDNADDPINMENTPPAPPLPLTHQKLILVVEKLASWLKPKLIQALDRKIFTLKTCDQDNQLETLMSLAHFYIGLTDIEDENHEVSTARLFIYKALYYYNHKSFPLIYAMLSAQPSCLPKVTNTVYKDDDPLVTIIKSILMNSPKDQKEKSEFKKRELRAMLLTQFGYQPFKPATDIVITELVERLKKNQLYNLDYSFILLAKRYGYEWAMSKIIKAHLYPLLEQLMTLSMESDIHDEKIVVCLRIISAILKTYPSNVDTTYFLQLFQTVLDRSPKPKIQEAAVEALIRFQRFGYVDIYQRIRKWNPQHKISPKLILMMKSFVYRKELKFWIELSKTPC